MGPWLNPQEVQGILRLHDSFDVYKELGQTLEEMVRLRLPGLVAPEKLTELSDWLNLDPVPKNAEHQTYLDAIKYYLCYVAWADYHFDGDVEYTATGPVQKRHDDSDAISDKRRTEIRIKYERLAETYAQQLLALRKPEPCATTQSGGNQQFSKAVGARSTARKSRWCW